jgi:hypothetical protein
MPNRKAFKTHIFETAQGRTTDMKEIKKSNYFSVLRIRIRDPGLGAFLTPGSGMGETGSGMNNPDHIF